LAVVLLAATALGDGEGFDERRSAAAEQAADARRKQIRAEIRALGTHEWAGEYYAGDGLGMNTRLILAPRAGHVFEWSSCGRLADRNYGAIASDGRDLRLSFTFENRPDGFFGVAPLLSVVPWGARRYLVPADDIVGFCNQINGGSEPRTDMHGLYFLRCGDEDTAVDGVPELPLGYGDYLLKSPVEATVLSVGAPSPPPSGIKWKRQDIPLTLDAGSDQGLKVGMQVFVIEPWDIFSLSSFIRITTVESDRSEAILAKFLKESRTPEVGWRVSTSWRRALPAEK